MKLIISRALSFGISGTDIYVGGDEMHHISGHPITEHKYWKNGEPTIVLNFSVVDIATEGSKVYPCCGFSYNQLSRVIGLNGAQSFDLEHSGEGFFIVTSGDDIYVCGSGYYDRVGGYTGFVWKNGQSIFGYRENDTVADLAILDGVYYAVGTNSYGPNNIYTTWKLWKEGEEVSFDGNPEVFTAIFISGSDIYIAGSENNRAKYWKNGKGVEMPGDYSYGVATAITVRDQDVYVVGKINQVYIVWKNGVPLQDYPFNGTEPAVVFHGVLINEVN